MRRLLVLAIFTLAYPVAASAQEETPRYEVYGSFSYMRADEDLSGFDETEDFSGFDVGFIGNWNRWFGLEASVAGHYDRTTVGGFLLPNEVFPPDVTPRPFQADVETSVYTFLVGPRISARGERVTGYAHALFGTARRNLDAEGTLLIPGFQPAPVDYENNDGAFGMALGGGVEVNVNDNFAVRAFQADYVLTTFDAVSPAGDDTQSHVRFSAGLVVRF